MSHPTLTLRSLVARPVVLKLKRPVVARIATISEWPLILIDLLTEEGIVGRSYLEPYLVRSMRYIVPALHDFGAMLKGRRIAPVELFDEARKSLHFVGYEGISLIAASGLDMAAWDVLAKAAGRPLCALLGGSVGAVRSYNSNGLWLNEPEAAAEEALELRDEGGFSGLKLRLGRERVSDDLKTLDAVRKAIGDEMHLMIDFNQGLNLADVSSVIAACSIDAHCDRSSRRRVWSTCISHLNTDLGSGELATSAQYPNVASMIPARSSSCSFVIKPRASVTIAATRLLNFLPRRSGVTRLRSTSPASGFRKRLAFNRPQSLPRVLVAQSMVSREGLNLHQACRVVILLHPEWNPGVVEQQIGRVDRVGSRWAEELRRAIESGGDKNKLPRIEIRPVIFEGTYDEHHWKVLNDRWDDLRAQLHGIVVPQRFRQDLPDDVLALVRELDESGPDFSPKNN
jgi:hypothetical protein